MASYREALELIIKRQFGIYGPEKVIEFTKKMGVEVDKKGRILKMPENVDEKEFLVKFVNEMKKELGKLSFLACKIALIYFFTKNKLKNPFEN